MRTLAVCAVVGMLVMPMAATAQVVTVSVTNNQVAGGMAFGGLWSAFTDGSFDAFDDGGTASAGVELLAELGDSSTLATDLGGAGVSGVVMSPSAPPPFTPGETGSLMINVGDPTTNRYFSYGAMVVPSNDLFIGNDDPTGIEVFDAGGNFLGPITITLFGSNVWDAGTEVNDFSDGPAFLVGQDATMGTTEGGTIQAFFSQAGATTYIQSLNGMDTPAYTLTHPLEAGDLLATITITPEPASLAMLALGSVMVVTRRRRR
jgi:hypothetical protein